MPLVKYVGNPAGDRTEQINLSVSKDGESRVLVLNGDAVEVNPDEFYSILGNGYVLEMVEDKTDNEGSVLNPETSLMPTASGASAPPVSRVPPASTSEPSPQTAPQSA